MAKNIKEIENIRRQYELFYLPKIKKDLKRQINPLIEKIKKADNSQSILAYAEFWNPQRDEIEDDITGIYTIIGQRFAKRQYDALTSKGTFEYNKKQSADFLDRILSFISDFVYGVITEITGYTKEEAVNIISRVLLLGIENNLTIDEMVDIILLEFENLSEYRAERIVRTEIIRASNLGEYLGAKATGLNIEKTWLTFVDNRTRDSHIAVNGEKRHIDLSFTVGGKPMQYPGDPSGGAKETINCRCAVQYREKR